MWDRDRFGFVHIDFDSTARCHVFLAAVQEIPSGGIDDPPLELLLRIGDRGRCSRGHDGMGLVEVIDVRGWIGLVCIKTIV